MDGSGTPIAHKPAEELTKEERRSIFLEQFGIVAGIKDQIAALNEDLKKAKRNAKNLGVASEDLNWALAAREKDDTELIVAELRRRAEISQWLNFMPAGFQIDLFDDNRTAEQVAFAKGAIAASFNANQSPRPDSDGYDPTSSLGQAYLRGHAHQVTEAKAHLASAHSKLAAQMAQPDDTKTPAGRAKAKAAKPAPKTKAAKPKEAKPPKERKAPNKGPFSVVEGLLGDKTAGDGTPPPAAA